MTMQVYGKGARKIRPALSYKPLNRIGVSNEVGGHYSCRKFHYDLIRSFCSPPSVRTLRKE